MPDRFAELTVRLEQILHQVTTETDPVVYDKLCTELREILKERARIQGQPPPFE